MPSPLGSLRHWSPPATPTTSLHTNTPPLPSHKSPIPLTEEEADEARDTVAALPPSRLPGLLGSPPVDPRDDVSAPQSLDEAVEEFFGTDALQELKSASTENLRLSRTFSRYSILSTLSKQTVLKTGDVLKCALEVLCSLIDVYPSLQDAKIASSECYTKPIALGTGLIGIVHRFLVIELSRDGHKTIWLRLERSRDTSEGNLRFLRGGAETLPIDHISIAASKNALIRTRRRPENQQTFHICPRLKDLRHLVYIIGSELPKYQLFLWNCWYFVSLLQQYLGTVGEATLQGKIPVPDWDQLTRDTIEKRVTIQRALEDAADSDRIISINSPNCDLADAETYLRYIFRLIPGLEFGYLSLLAHKSQGSYEWIITASRFIAHGDTRNSEPRTRLNQVLSGGEGLDALYTMVLGSYGIGNDLEVQLRFLKLVVYARGMQLDSLLDLVTPGYFPLGVDVRSKMQHLSPLIAGLNNGSCITPRLLSFVDFLSNTQRSGKFCIHSGEPLRLRTRPAEWYIGIMDGQLRFNIANIPTSCFRNRDIPKIREHVETNITPLLLHSCQFWPLYASVELRAGTTISSLAYFLENRILQWLEVMSLTRSSPEQALAPLAAVTTLPSAMSTLIANSMQFVKTFATPIMSSVPHIYVSALAFMPECSVVASQQQLHPGIVRVSEGALQEWPCSLQIFEGHSLFVNSVTFSPDGTRVASGSADKTIRLWDARTGVAIGQPLVGHTGWVLAVAFSLDGAQIASGSDDYTVRLWDVQTGAAIGQPLVGHSGVVWSVAFSPNGAQIASGSSDGTIRLWDTWTGTAIGQPLVGHSDAVWSVAFCPNGAQIASGSVDDKVRLWGAQTGTVIRLMRVGHSGRVTSVAFSPDGTRIASGSYDGTVRMGDAETGAAIGQPLFGHSYQVNSVAFSPDGAWIVSGSQDKTVRLWDTRTGAAIGQLLMGHSDSVMSVAFSPDGARIVSGSGDGTVRLWDAERALSIHRPSQRSTTEDSGPVSASSNQSNPPNSDVGVGDVSLSAAELDKHSPQRASSGELILKDGWIIGAAGELLLWVPPVHWTRIGSRKESVLTEFDRRLFTIDPTVMLDFRSFKCGTEWTQCRGSGN